MHQIAQQLPPSRIGARSPPLQGRAGPSQRVQIVQTKPGGGRDLFSRKEAASLQASAAEVPGVQDAGDDIEEDKGEHLDPHGQPLDADLLAGEEQISQQKGGIPEEGKGSQEGAAHNRDISAHGGERVPPHAHQGDKTQLHPQQGSPQVIF